MFDLLLLTGVAGSFLVILPGRVDGDELFARYFLSLVTILSFFIAPKRDVGSKTLGVFLFVVLASVFFNYHTPQIGVFKELLIGFLALKVISERTSLTSERFGKFLLCFWTFLNGLLLVQSLGFIYKGQELAGPFIVPWMMGCAACLSIPFVRTVNKWACIVLLPAILFSHSTACAAVALAMLFQIKTSFKTMGMLVILLLCFVLFFDNAFESTRFGIWKNTFAYIHNFWIGNGIGSWMHMAFYRMNGATPIHWTSAHNLYYQVFFEMGIVGFVALMIALREVWVRSFGVLRSAVLGLLMLSFVHPIVHFPRFSVFLVVLTAMIFRGDGVSHETV